MKCLRACSSREGPRQRGGSGGRLCRFREAKDATRAISQLDGLEIAGIRIKVEMAAGDLPVFMHPGMPPPEPASLEEGGARAPPPPPPPPAHVLVKFVELASSGCEFNNSCSFRGHRRIHFLAAASKLSGRDQGVSSSCGGAGEGSGMRLTADKRSQLMNRLAGQELPPPPGAAPAAPASAAPRLRPGLHAGSRPTGSSPCLRHGMGTVMTWGFGAAGTGPPPPAEAQTAPTAPPLNPLSYVQVSLPRVRTPVWTCLACGVSMRMMWKPAAGPGQQWSSDVCPCGARRVCWGPPLQSPRSACC